MNKNKEEIEYIVQEKDAKKIGLAFWYNDPDQPAETKRFNVTALNWLNQDERDNPLHHQEYEHRIIERQERIICNSPLKEEIEKETQKTEKEIRQALEGFIERTGMTPQSISIDTEEVWQHGNKGGKIVLDKVQLYATT